jgi:translation elongation factor EF-4
MMDQVLDDMDLEREKGSPLRAMQYRSIINIRTAKNIS